MLYNVPEFKSVGPSDIIPKTLGLNTGTCVILHQGNVQKDRGCFVLAKAMRQVEGAVLVFLGDGPLKGQLKDYVEKAGLSDRVRFISKVDPIVLLDYTASADIGVTLLEDTCLNHRFALPNKLFEYLMSGLPVLASDLPEIRKVVNRFKVGELVNPSSPDSVAKGLMKLVAQSELRNSYKQNIPSVFETFSWEQASQEYASRYKELLSR